MNHEKFNELAQARVTACLGLLIPKGEEYSRNGDRLHNFKTAAAIDGETPARALWGMYKKHLVSVKDIVDDLEQGIIPDAARLAEKMNDSINYHLLLEGLIEDARVSNAVAPLVFPESLWDSYTRNRPVQPSGIKTIFKAAWWSALDSNDYDFMWENTVSSMGNSKVVKDAFDFAWRAGQEASK